MVWQRDEKLMYKNFVVPHYQYDIKASSPKEDICFHVKISNDLKENFKKDYKFYLKPKGIDSEIGHKKPLENKYLNITYGELGEEGWIHTDCPTQDEKPLQKKLYESVTADLKVKKKEHFDRENNFELTKGEFGYVYCITNDSWKDWVKVGMAINLRKRVASFSRSNPSECKVIDYHLTDKLNFYENLIHSHFNKFVRKKKRKEKFTSPYRTSLEWHNVSVAEAKELFTSAIQIVKDKHLKEQMS